MRTVSGCLLNFERRGVQVSLSTFLVIGATSSLTYNVVGHIKTVIILMGGCMFFGDEMPLKKLAGISVAMSGIIWYSQVSISVPDHPLQLLPGHPFRKYG